MPVTLLSDDFPLSPEKITVLWQQAVKLRGADEASVSIRSVSEVDMQSLNKQYRGHGKPTNVLTFSYPLDERLGEESGSHDVALCLAVAEREARQHGVQLADYVALLLVHAFLHVLGMDHEQSEEQDQAMRQHEERILANCGFTPLNLAGL